MDRNRVSAQVVVATRARGLERDVEVARVRLQVPNPHPRQRHRGMVKGHTLGLTTGADARMPASSRAAARRSRFSRASLGTTSTSVVRCEAPCRIAASPPIRTYRTACRSSTSKMRRGSNSAIGVLHRELRFALQLPGRDRSVQTLVEGKPSRAPCSTIDHASSSRATTRISRSNPHVRTRDSNRSNDGETRPASIRAIRDCETSARSATCCWVRPARRLASRSNCPLSTVSA